MVTYTYIHNRIKQIVIFRMMAESGSTSCYVVGKRPHVKYEGTMKKCFGNDAVEYAAFLGIPYAVAPEGLKRYQAPETLDSIDPALLEASTLNDPIPTYKANKTGKMSTQLHVDLSEGSSDCLYLNIFLPKRPEDVKTDEDLFPVLVLIHGGGFAYGSNDPDTYTPDSIIQHGLVFVTMNYRLGLSGFFNMRSETAPGNTGLKDQVKALEWIRENIACFKGNPKNVTISGCSAGGTCVNLHLISPVSQELFDKAIVQSGGIYCPWGYRGHRREQMKLLFSDPECRDLLLAEQESRNLQKFACYQLYSDREARHPQSLSPLFGPSVEKYQEGAFLPYDVELMMRQVDHNKPVIAGITKEEGIYQYAMDPTLNYRDWVNDDQKFRKLLMDNFRWSDATAEKYVDRIRDRYFPDRQNMSAPEKDRCLANLFTDIFFRRFYDNFKFGPEEQVHKNLYVYQFNHASQISQTQLKRMRRYLDDASHGDDVTYLYCPYKVSRALECIIYDSSCQNKEIQEVMNHMCSLWANFCKTGIPKSDFAETVVWSRHTEEEPCYLSISKDLTLVKGSLYQERWEWLNSLVDPESPVNSLAVTPEPDE